MFVPNSSPAQAQLWLPKIVANSDYIRVDPFKIASFVTHLLYSYHFIRLIQKYLRHFACPDEMEDVPH